MTTRSAASFEAPSAAARAGEATRSPGRRHRLDDARGRAYPRNVPVNISGSNAVLERAATGKGADLGRIPSLMNERVSPLLHDDSARRTPTEKLEES